MVLPQSRGLQEGKANVLALQKISPKHEMYYLAFYNQHLMGTNPPTLVPCPHHGLPGCQDYILIFFLSGVHGLTWLTLFDPIMQI